MCDKMMKTKETMCYKILVKTEKRRKDYRHNALSLIPLICKVVFQIK